MKQFFKISLLLVYLIIFCIPAYTFFVVSPANFSLLVDRATIPVDRLFIVFRLCGLYAFTLIWSQIILGTLRIPLTKIYGSRILKVHMTLGLFTLLFTILHPLFFYMAHLLQHTSPFEAMDQYLGPSADFYGDLGVIAIGILFITVCTAQFRTHPLLKKYWRLIHYANYLIFILVFLHSYNIGSEVHLQPLRSLYTFFGITFLGASIYKLSQLNYIKKLFNSH